MRLKLTYFVENPINDTERNVEITSEHEYPSDENEDFIDAFGEAVAKAEAVFDLTLDCGGDDVWYEIDAPDIVYEDEVKEMAPKFVAALKEIENGLVKWEVKG